MSLVVDIHEIDGPSGVTLVTVEGDLGLATARRFSSVVDGADHGDGHGLVLDLSDLASLDSSGLSAILSLFHDTRAAGGHLAVVATDPSLRRMFAVTSLTAVLGVVPSREQAFAAVAAAA